MLREIIYSILEPYYIVGNKTSIMKPILPAIIFILGIISICAFLTPIILSFPYIPNQMNPNYNYIAGSYPTYIGHSNIFSESQIVASRLITYIIIWTLLCLGLHLILKNLNNNKSY